MGLVVLGGASSSYTMPATKPGAWLGFRGRARRGVAELHDGAETGEEEARVPDVAREGAEGGGSGARCRWQQWGRACVEEIMGREEHGCNRGSGIVGQSGSGSKRFSKNATPT
jgi:hypothetical protein